MPVTAFRLVMQLKMYERGACTHTNILTDYVYDDIMSVHNNTIVNIVGNDS